MDAAPDASRVEARIELTQADVLHGLQAMPERRFGAILVYILAPLLLVGTGIFKGFDLAILLSIAGCSVLMVGVSTLSTRRIGRQIFEDMSKDRREISFVFTPASVEIATRNTHARNDYEGIRRYVITRHTLLLYVSGTLAQIVPLRAIDAADRERVFGWLKASVKPAPRVPSAVGRTLMLWAVLVLAFGLIWWFLNP
jgi:putative effector of murein hydrolase LrgA (UPF0299 family)